MQRAMLEATVLDQTMPFAVDDSAHADPMPHHISPLRFSADGRALIAHLAKATLGVVHIKLIYQAGDAGIELQVLPVRNLKDSKNLERAAILLRSSGPILLICPWDNHEAVLKWARSGVWRHPKTPIFALHRLMRRRLAR